MQPNLQRTIKPSQWITDDEVKDPPADELPDIKGWFILARPLRIVRKTKGGIIIPDSSMDDVERGTCIARVLKMGNLCYTHKDFQGSPWCAVGDNVGYGIFAGYKYVIKGIKMIMLEDREIRFTVQNPEDFDINYGISRY